MKFVVEFVRVLVLIVVIGSMIAHAYVKRVITR